MFLPNVGQICSLGKVCHLFKEICEINILWMPILKNNFPKIYLNLDFEKTPKATINWKSMVKEN